MTTQRTEYGIQVTRPDGTPHVYRWSSLALAHEVQQDWSARPDRDGFTYTVVSRTVTVTDWAPVDPPEATS